MASVGKGTRKGGPPQGRQQQPNRWSNPPGGFAQTQSRAPQPATAPAPQSAAPNGFGGQASPSLGARGLFADPSQSGKHMHDRLVFLILSLVGCKVVATVKGGARLEGILASATTEGDLGICLRLAQVLGQPNAPVHRTLLIFGRDLHEIVAQGIDLDEQHDESAFKTDADIGVKGPARAGGGEKELQKWSGGATGGADGGLEDGAGSKWDQFATNAQLFGTSTDYNEELYTTALDRTRPDYKDREKKAERLAQEIMGMTSANTHVAEERGHDVDENGLDEESKHSAVIRSPGAYVPPAARRAGGPPDDKPAVNGSATGQAATPKVTVTASVSHRLPSITTSAEDGPTKPTTAANEVVRSFSKFVSSEKERLLHRKDALARKEKDTRLADLREFSASFKLRTPVPNDLATIIGKPSEKALEAAAKRKEDAATKPANPPKALNPKLAKLGLSSIPEIPPFNPRGRPPDGAAAPALKPAGATVKPAAPKVVKAPLVPPIPPFKPNPAAKTFTPVTAAPPASSLTAGTGSKPNSAGPPQDSGANPFFGDRAIRKGSSSTFYVKEDFTPFKGGTAVDPSTVALSWPFGNKSYRSLFPLGPEMDEPAPAPGPSTIPGPPPVSVAMAPPPGGYPAYPAYPPPPFRYPAQGPPQHPPPQHMHPHAQPQMPYPQQFVQMPPPPFQPPPNAHSQPHPNAPVYSPQMAAMAPPPHFQQPGWAPGRPPPAGYPGYPPAGVPVFPGGPPPGPPPTFNG